MEPAKDILETEKDHLPQTGHGLCVCFQIFVASVYLPGNNRQQQALKAEDDLDMSHYKQGFPPERDERRGSNF